MNKQSTINEYEIAKFAKLSQHWWDTEGDLRTLHDINSARLNFIKQHSILQGMLVLDVGCGGGILSEAMAREGAIVTGIDAEESAIKVAHEHAGLSQLPIDYLCTPIEEYESGLFDLVTCMEMLEHVDEPQWIVKHCVRLLKPGGFLFLSTLNRSLMAYLTAVVAAEYILQLLPKQTHDYHKFIKPAELAEIARAEHLEVIGLNGMLYNPLNRTVSLQESVNVNYLMCCRKAE